MSKELAEKKAASLLIEERNLHEAYQILLNEYYERRAQKEKAKRVNKRVMLNRNETSMNQTQQAPQEEMEVIEKPTNMRLRGFSIFD